MGIDDQHDDGLGGRSRTRREVSAANRWARPLCTLHPVELAAAPLPDEVREAVALARSIDSPRARSRQHQRIDKLVRDLDDDLVAAIDAFLADPSVAFREIDSWCDRLIQEGDPAIDAFLQRWPEADRQRLRTLARNARAGGPERRRALRAALVGVTTR